MQLRKLLSAFLLSACLYSSGAAADLTTLPLPPGKDVSARFVGTVYRNDLIATDDVYHLTQTNVITFVAGSHSGWHSHGAMTVIGIAGTGLYQEYGKAPVLIHPGDVKQIPAGVSHFHGATKNSNFQQFVIYDSQWKPGGTVHAHTRPLTESEYRSIPSEEAKKSTHDNQQGFLFGRSLKKMQSPNFNHPVYLTTLLSKPNAPGSPVWTYVAFPKGTYNRWHSHKTGQVLIATDGVGYHQIQGQPLQILHPGDVVFCPPGAIHFHGATPDHTFAHIAINPEDNHEVTWYSFPKIESPKV